jgi:hypothetical protein
MGYMFAREVPPQLRLLLWVIPFPGILVSFFRLRLVRSYRHLSAAKFRVVKAIEEQRPLAPFTAEWIALRKESSARQYVPLTNVEVWIPRSFMLLYIAILLLLIPWHELFWFLRPHLRNRRTPARSRLVNLLRLRPERGPGDGSKWLTFET